MDEMKTTIDIPEPLYKKAKIRAIEEGKSLKQLVVESLGREIDLPQSGSRSKPRTFGEKRRVLPKFTKLDQSGQLTPGKGKVDVTQLISEDRDGR